MENTYTRLYHDKMLLHWSVYWMQGTVLLFTLASDMTLRDIFKLRNSQMYLKNTV